MPTYVYRCDFCEHLFEAIHSYKERLEDCPACSEKKSLKKQLNTPIYLLRKNQDRKKQAGEVVREEIRRNKEDLKRQVEETRKRNNKK
jgi:putative FmdB family regulatory protein